MGRRSMSGLVACILCAATVLSPDRASAQSDGEPKVQSKSLGYVDDLLEGFTLPDAHRPGIGVGDRAMGELAQGDPRISDDDTPIDMFEFRGTRGDIVEFSVRSDDFRPLVWVFHPDDNLLMAGDYDAENDGSASMTMAVPRDGDYVLAVNSLGGFGRYEVRVDRLPPLALSESTAAATRIAVLIGINDYPGVRNDLSAPVPDVDAMRALLTEDAGFDSAEIVTVKDQHATRDNVVDILQRLRGSVRADATVILYFSGHGLQLSPEWDAESDRRDEALFLADGSYLVDHDLRSLADCIRAKAVTIIVDACYSGGIDRGNGEKRVVGKQVRKYVDLARREGVEPTRCPNRPAGAGKDVNLVISASGENQRAWEWDVWEDLSQPRSVFTRYLIDAISHALRKSPGISVASLIDGVVSNTTEFTQEHMTAVQEGRVVNLATPELTAREPAIGDVFGLAGASSR